ncbi:His/Gly/Thr/Pro-type tRNA ligase C-terminal domain-containing protein [Candidatus Wolfebacteria bacterium]|nr:His/Gly/Thr/Pro-type tRNA ligase C-terminal domain-containing protein [Candidatus Wolfebacteria bacterium]
MRQRHLFTKTRKEAPTDEVAKNAQLLIRGGFVHKEMAGVYDYLPLGLRVLNKITGIIREEMDKIGGQELLLSALQSKEVWEKSGRWSDGVIDVWFKSTLTHGAEVGLGNTHEEPLTALVGEHVSSYKDLPRYIYQIQTKFRNELRAKSGILRAREFLMKDLYSFSRTEEEFRLFYEECAAAYLRIFERVGLGELTYRTFASGGPFSDYSDEFQTLCDVGEDTIYVDEERRVAVNKEVYTDKTLDDLHLDKTRLVEKRGIEVGNIFPLGTRFSEALGLRYRDADGNDTPVVMGSYGIGPGRVMGTIVELYSDNRGIIWPESVAPFRVHLVALAGEEGKGVRTEAEKLYTLLVDAGIETLYDDREASPGEKLADADLIGIPWRVVVSEKTQAQHALEIKNRKTGATEMLGEKELFDELKTEN